MNNVLSLFVGPESQKLSYFLYNLEVLFIRNFRQNKSMTSRQIRWTIL